MEITVKFGTHVVQSYFDIVPIHENNIFVLVDEGNNKDGIGETLYGYRIGMESMAIWAFPKKCVRDLTDTEMQSIRLKTKTP